MSNEALTMREMCEAILASPRCPPELKAKYPTPRELFHYSPTGELFMLWEWYDAFVTDEIDGMVV